MPRETVLDRRVGRDAFGDDPANYHAARPPYPAETWSWLRQHAGLRPGIDILEIGAGTGLATGPLLAQQPASLLAVEPDARLADYLRTSLPDPRLTVHNAPFETADLRPASFDLVVSATAFHWLDAVPALRRIRELLRPGGNVALWWNLFGDQLRADAFHEATTHLFAGHAKSLSGGGNGRPPHAVDTEARLADFAAAGFVADAPLLHSWPVVLDPPQVRNLYATFSNVTVLPPGERTRLLDGLADVAATQFGGRVERQMTLAMYVAHRN